MGLTDRVSSAWKALTRSQWPTLTWQEYAELTQFGFGGNNYVVANLNQTLKGQTEDIDGSFTSLVSSAYRGNGVVFACMLTRLLIFSEARFQFRRMTNGRPGDLFGNKDLAPLESPWPGGTTGDLLARMITDADLAGNAFITRRGTNLRRLRPDWVSIILGSDSDSGVQAGDIDAEVLGYVYYPGGKNSGRDPEILLREQVAHFAPVPDPLASFRGMSWLTPIVREIMADSSASSFKNKLFENGATPNMIVKRVDSPAPDVFADWVKLMESKHAGVANAYKTLYLTAGADATVVGKDMQQLEFKATQGAGETRIAAAAGVHPVIVGLSEGMQGSSLNAGNFGSARRLTADKTFRPLWRNVSGSLATLISVPSNAALWYDDRDIAFLREDMKDAAEIQQIKAASIRQLVDAGYKPDSVVKAIESEDMGLLAHSDLYSVQLQPPMPDGPPKPEPVVVPSENGNGRHADEAWEALVRMVRPAEPASVNFHEGAFRIEAPRPADVNMTVEAPPPAEVTVNVPEQRAPQVTVEAPPPAEVNVTVESPPPAEVTVNMPEPKPVKRRIKREKGLITEIVEE